MEAKGKVTHAKTDGVVDTDSVDSEKPVAAESMHKQANEQDDQSKNETLTDEASAASLTVQQPKGLTEVIETVSPEQFPEYVRKNDSTLTFPEKLMLMLVHVQQVYAKQAKKLEDQSINWSDNGKSFVIRDKDALCKTWVPAFFGQAKFSSFTRKLYRWGFRKVNVSVNDKGEQIVVFSNENFQRDDVSRLGKMQSITAAKIRNQLAVKSGLRREPAPENTSNVGNAGSTTGQSSAVEQLLRDRCSVTETARVANPGLLQYQHDRDQDILRTRSLLASRLNNSMGLLPTIEDATLLAQQQTALNRYRQSSVSLPTLTALGNYSSGLGNTPGMSLAARSQLDNLRLLETLDRQRATGIGPISNDGAFEPLLLQRQLRAAQMPTVDLASISSLDAYARIRGELESNITRQNLLTVPLQQGLHNRSSENLDRRYLAALAALLNHQNNR